MNELRDLIQEYEIEKNISNIPKLRSLYIFFDKDHHDSGYNYMTIIGADEKEDYKKIIVVGSDVVNINILFAKGQERDINFDFRDGEFHIWSDKNYFIPTYIGSNFEFDVVKKEESDNQ